MGQKVSINIVKTDGKVNPAGLLNEGTSGGNISIGNGKDDDDESSEEEEDEDDEDEDEDEPECPCDGCNTKCPCCVKLTLCCIALLA